MDYVTRQFIVLAKKFRKELHKYQETLHRDLTQLSNGFKNLKDSVDSQRKSNEEARQTNTAITIANLRTDVPILVQDETKKTEKKRVWPKIKSALEAFAYIAVIGYTIETYQIWQETITANNISMSNFRRARIDANGQLKESRNNFEVSQRAWLGMEAVLVIPKPIGTPNNLVAFKFVWKNTGLTPALEARIHPAVTYREREYLVISDFSKINTKQVPEPGPKINSSSVIAPSGGTGSTPIYYTPNPMPNKHLFLIAEFTYKDVFDQWHTTQVCQMVEDTLLPYCNIHNTMN
jgi:hypothetical protein